MWIGCKGRIYGRERNCHSEGEIKKLEYEDRTVVFLDVLGFSNFTNYTGTTQINQDKKVENVNKYLEMLHKFFKSENAIAPFSISSETLTNFSFPNDFVTAHIG